MQSPSPLNRRSVIVLCGLAVLWTVLVVQHSLHFGKLSFEPNFDDNTYLNEGYGRLARFHREQDPGALLVGIARAHSPWMSLLATTAFALFGVHDWAPYLFNGIGIALWFCGLAYVLRPGGRLLLAAGLLWIVSSNLGYLAVSELRPDFFNGLAVATGAVLVFMAATREGRRSLSAARAGHLLIAASLFVKPTFFAGNLFVWGCVSGLVLLHDLLHRSPGAPETRRDRGLQTVGWLLRTGWPALLLAALLLGHRAGYYIDYLVRNSFGEHADIWRIEGGRGGALAYYTTGWGARWALGPSLLAPWLPIFAWAALAGVRRDGPALRMLGLLGGATGAALFVVVMGGQDSPFFGLTYLLLLLYTSAWAVGQLGAQMAFRWWRTGLAALLAISLFGNIRRHDTWAAERPSIAAKEDSLAQAMMADLIAAQGAERTTVFLGFVGAINRDTLYWLAQTRRLPWTFYAHDREEPLARYWERVAQADYVLTAEEGAPELMTYLPTVREHHAAFHEAMLEHPDFELIARYPTYAAGGYALFARRPAAP
ncbi:MAG: hypothetical protein ACLFU2_05920, partial [Opitutales bacterium]